MTVRGTTSSYTILTADLERDRDTVIGVWSRNLPAHSASEHAARYDWAYRHNPLGRGWIFLARDDSSGTIIGTAGIGRRQIRVEEKSLPAGIAEDFAIDADHRTARAAMMLARAAAGLIGELGFIYGFPSRQAAGIFKRIGYVEAARSVRFVKIVHSVNLLRNRGVPSILCRPAAALIDLRLRLRGARVTRGANTRIGEIQVDDPRLTALLSDAHTITQVSIERTSEFLRWRYEQCPIHRYWLLGVEAENQQQLLGFIACYLGEQNQIEVEDIAYRPTPEAPLRVLGALLEWSRCQPCTIACIDALNASTAFQRAFRYLGFTELGDGAAVISVLQDPKLRVDWQVCKSG